MATLLTRFVIASTCSSSLAPRPYACPNHYLMPGSVSFRRRCVTFYRCSPSGPFCSHSAAPACRSASSTTPHSAPTLRTSTPPVPLSLFTARRASYILSPSASLCDDVLRRLGARVAQRSAACILGGRWSTQINLCWTQWKATSHKTTLALPDDCAPQHWTTKRSSSTSIAHSPQHRVEEGVFASQTAMPRHPQQPRRTCSRCLIDNGGTDRRIERSSLPK